jgi:predicted nicotinamide N-methyase
MSVVNLALQLPPAGYIVSTIKAEWADWPSIESQCILAQQFSATHIADYPPPAKGWKYLLKSIEKDIRAYYDEHGGEGDAVFADELMEVIVQSQCVVVGDDESGHLSFPSISSRDSLVPIKVIQSHNQVGTRVWGAGVYLGELFQRVPTLLTNTTVLELGAGVGITALLLACATPPQLRPSKVIMTDFHHAVVNILEENIELNSAKYCADHCPMEADTLDWATVEEADFLRYNANVAIAADCTYSESGNVNLVRAFKLFLNAMGPLTTPSERTGGKESDTSTQEEHCYCTKLLGRRIPFVLIACTVRNPATYEHFRRLLQEDCDFHVEDMTQWAAAQFPAVPTYFYPEDRSRIQLLCIHHARHV